MAGYRTSGSVYQIELSHEEVNAISSNVGAAAAIVAPIPAAQWASAVLGAIGGLLVTVDQVGGEGGVNVVGVLNTQFVTVTPAGVSPVGVVKTFADGLVGATGLPDGVVGAGIGAGVAMLAVGPAGVVIGGIAGALGALSDGGPSVGDLHADRTEIGPWEKFRLVCADGGHVAIGAGSGYFCAENGGGGPIHANRRDIGDWEKFTIVRNSDGTVSLRAKGGHYLVAERGGGAGSVCNCDRTAIGPWEKFWMETLPGGQFALKTLNAGTYVSAQFAHDPVPDLAPEVVWDEAPALVHGVDGIRTDTDVTHRGRHDESLQNVRRRGGFGPIRPGH